MSLKLDCTLESFRNIKKCRGLGASWWFGGWDSVLSLPSCTVLSCFSHVQLIVAVWTETRQTPARLLCPWECLGLGLIPG